jgi:hypothetical protein
MCTTHAGDHDQADLQPLGPSYFFANLRQPGPLGWKLRRTLANTATKLIRLQRCCGNGGEPGC